MDTVTVALEGVDRLRVQLEELQKELRELRVQLEIARNAARVATGQRDYETARVGRLQRRLRLYEPEPTKAAAAAERRAKRPRKE